MLAKNREKLNSISQARDYDLRVTRMLSVELSENVERQVHHLASGPLIIPEPVEILGGAIMRNQEHEQLRGRPEKCRQAVLGQAQVVLAGEEKESIMVCYPCQTAIGVKPEIENNIHPDREIVELDKNNFD